MVDIHSHILPGIDDGAKTIDDSLELCRIAAGDGIETIVTTPHMMEFRYPNTRESIEAPFAQLSRAVESAKIPIRLVPGSEVHIAANLVPRLRDGDLMTYNDNRKYMLLEFPFQQIVSGTEEVVYRLKLAGVTPVVAHPERIGFFMNNLNRLEALVRLGALAQVTGGSLLGTFGATSERAAWRMVERRLVHVVASDGHDQKYRRPELRAATQLLAERVGDETARRMAEEIPRAIVDGTDVDVPEPLAAPGGFKGFMNQFFSRG